MNYQAIPFSGEWDEDPENLLGWFLQCVGTADDERKAQHFVYYLPAGSDADEWFEDIPEEEKDSWAKIEKLFCRRWLKGGISTKESVISKNKQQPTSIHPTITLSTSHSTSGTHTNPLGNVLGITTDYFTQTNPISIPMNCHITKPSRTSFSSSPANVGTEIEFSTSPHSEIGHPTCAAIPQPPPSSGNRKSRNFTLQAKF